MERIDYLFMFRADTCDPDKHRAVIATPEGDVTIVGVPTLEQACRVAAAAAMAGTADFIELCGDFGEDGCRRVIAAVDGRLPVGYVTYLPEELTKLDALFEKAQA
jgi:hypothetical protein